MRVSVLFGVVLLAVFPIACGGSKGTSAKSSAANGAAAPAAADATAAQVAKEMRGSVSCPAKIATAARAPGAPVADIVGIRPGLTYDEAANLVLCDNPMLVIEADTSGGFQINTFGQKIRPGFSAKFAEARVEKTSRQILQEMQEANFARGSNSVVPYMKAGEVQYGVGAVGTPGQERVTHVAREEWFEEGKNPTVANVEQALITKYGPPTVARDDGGFRYLRWAYDPSGRRIDDGSPLLDQCAGPAGPSDSINVSTDCGVVVSARIFGLPSNAGLAKSMQVGAVDQADAFRAIKSTEDILRQQDEVRKAKELSDAAKIAVKPKM